MRGTICLSAVLAFCAYSNQAAAQTTASDTQPPAGTAAPPAQPAPPPADQATPPAAPATEQAAPAAAPAAQPAAFQLNGTTWTFTDKDRNKVQESIDASGNYIANTVDGKHLDHGTSVMKGDKACFTSAMGSDGEVCWTTKPVEIGQSLETVSDKGEKLTVTRVAYVPMSIPAQKPERG